MDVVARMHGGGVSAQAGALRHGISRALLEADPNLRGELKRRGFLTRDARAKERKKAGLKKARKRPQFSQALARESAARKLFGTDGVRGVAGEKLTAELALALGRAATEQATSGDAGRPRVLIIRDTRESGEMLEAALAAGVAAAGGDVVARRRAADAGRAAARRPLRLRPRGGRLARRTTRTRDNGIKFFGADGFKLADADEEAIEARLDASRRRRLDARSGASARCTARRRTTCARCTSASRPSTSAGSTSCSTAPTARPTSVGPGDLPPPRRDRHRRSATSPTGATSTTACGSTHVDGARRTRSSRGGHDVGFAFDGDGDRVLAVDRTGAVVDGDELIALAALHLRAAGRLPGDGVAVTVMTNYGFHAAMARPGIEVATTPVGDRYVLEALRERGWALGGEQSGPHHRHGLRAVRRRHRERAADARGAAPAATSPTARAMEKLPQRLVNVPRRRPRRGDERRRGWPRRSSARARALDGPRPRARAPERHRAARARDGRGADRRRGATRSAARLVALVAGAAG